MEYDRTPSGLYLPRRGFLKGAAAAAAALAVPAAAGPLINPYGLAAAGGGTWTTLSLGIPNSDSSGWEGYTLREALKTPILIAGTKIRLSLKSGSIGGMKVDACYIQTKGSGTFDFSGAPVQVTFNGGSAGFTIGAANLTQVSDDISFVQNGLTGLVIAIYFATTPTASSRAFVASGTTDHERAWKAGNDTTTTTVSGYSTSGNTTQHFASFEIFH